MPTADSVRTRRSSTSAPARGRRTITIAIASTLGAIAFAFSLTALLLDLRPSFAEVDGRGIGVIYTFERERCVGSTDQFRQCRWTGTISNEGQTLATDVRYADTLPADVAPGVRVNALWSPLDPQTAWSVETTRAWLNQLSSILVSGAMTIGLSIAAIYWWRRFARESSQRTAQRRSDS